MTDINSFKYFDSEQTERCKFMEKRNYVYLSLNFHID